MLKNWTIVRTFNGDTKRILGVWGCIGFAYFGVLGVLLNLYLLRLGFGVEFIGFLVASGQTLWAIMSLPAGAVSRRFGLRPILLLGLLLTASGMAMLISVELLPQAWWPGWIFGTWMVTWLGAAFITVNSTPFLMLAAGPEGRNHAFPAQAAGSALFGFLGGIIAGLLPGFFATIFGWSLDDPAPYRLALWLVPLTYLVATIIMAGASPLQLAEKSASQIRSKAPLGIFTFFVLLIFLQAVGGGAVRAFFNVFLDAGLQVPAARIGTIMGIGQLLPVFVSLLTPYALERWGTKGTISLVGAMMCITLIALGLSKQWLFAGLCFAILISINSVGGPARNIFSQELVVTEWRSMSSALNTLGLALGWAASAALGGYLIGRIGFGGFFFVCAVLAGLSTVVLLAGVRVPQLTAQPAADD